MNGKSDIPDISYFRLSLVDFLRESHPHMVNDRKFIAARTEAALDVYEKAILDGDNPLEAGEQANRTLFEGLCFSRYDTVRNIFWNEFSKEIPEEEAGFWVLLLLSECESVFAKYSLSDDFAYEPEYDLLYTELTGAIALLIETRNWLTPNVVS
ncbi:MAG: DUF1896 domain-containing protein [Dysgonamonadaceae bacterium]|jgi:hypothetical protein|nr:DUF1896 domain-containing protein [Dysgonamonadaceae bacterium]